MLLEGKCAFITGGANGIAFACAKKFLIEGAKVTIFDIVPQEKLDEAVKELSTFGEVYGVRGDVTNSESVQNGLNYAKEKMGKVTVGVNAAFVGIPSGIKIDEYDEEKYFKTVDVNFFGEFRCTKYEAKMMIEQAEGGSIVNFSSINAFCPTYGFGAYCASKAAINSMSNVAAVELGSANIRVNHVCPGFTLTEGTKALIGVGTSDAEIMDHTPLLRYNEPEDIANAVCFLASEMARNITGAEIVVDGGMQQMAYPQTRRFLMPPGRDFDEVFKTPLK